MKKSVLALAFLLLALPILPASAETESALSAETAEPILGYANVPGMFKLGVIPGISQEEFTLVYLMPLRKLSSNGEYLLLSDLTNLQMKKQHNTRLNRLQDTLKYDLDFDTNVTRDEVTKKLRMMWDERKILYEDADIERVANDVMIIDANKDGILDYQEMSATVEGAPQGVDKIGNQLLLDLSQLAEFQDGKLTFEEMTNASKGVFGIIDLDKNGFFSAEEVKAYREFTPPMTPAATQKCEEGEKSRLSNKSHCI